MMKAKMKSRAAKIPPFDAKKANVKKYPKVDEHGVTLKCASIPYSCFPHAFKPIDTLTVCCNMIVHSYVIGWILCPGYVRANLKYFSKFTAIDCAFAKRRGGGQGTFYLEAVLDAGRRIHPVSIMHILSAECQYGFDIHYQHTDIAYDGALNQSDSVMMSDGGVALTTGFDKNRTSANRLRDTRHLLQDIRCVTCTHTRTSVFTPHTHTSHSLTPLNCLTGRKVSELYSNYFIICHLRAKMKLM